MSMRNVRMSWICALSVILVAFAAVSGAYAEGIGATAGNLGSGRIAKDASGNAEGTVDVSAESYLNVRTGPGTNFEIIGKLTRGAKINAIEERLGWYKINYEGREAWVNGYYIEGIKASTEMPDVYGKVTVPEGMALSMRVGAGTENPVEGYLLAGTRVKVVDKQDGWYKIMVDGHERGLWVNGAFLTLIDTPLEDPPAAGEEPAYVNVGPNYHLLLRSGASSSSPILMELSDRTSLRIIEVAGDWYKVKTANGNVGYVSARYVTKGQPPAPGTSGTTPPVAVTPYTGEKNPIETMQLPADASGVTQDVAVTILSGLGYTKEDSFTGALDNFQSANFGNWNRGKKFTGGSLDANTKARLLEQAKMYKAALAKYPQGTISKDDPAFNSWVKAAESKLTSLPASVVDRSGNPISRETLLHGILKQESGKYHWKNRKVITSKVGAVGFMQIMPFNCGWAGNIFDPAENLAAGANYINQMLEKSFSQWQTNIDTPSDLVAKALAAYNGGPGREVFKTRSWCEIVRTNAIPRESIHYAIKIRQSMNMPILTVEEEWLAAR